MYQQLKEHGYNTTKRVYTIAEIGINHGGDQDTAKRLIDSAAKTGANAVKFQTYITEKRVPKEQKAIFDTLKKCELPFKFFQDLKEHAQQYELDFFSTPFDEESVDCLNEIGCQIFKIASFDICNRRLLKKIAKTGKTSIMSIGMASIEEAEEAYKVLTKNGSKTSILHCVSAYPTLEEDANLAAIFELKNRFSCVIGQSDHTPDIKVPLYAVAAGAQIIEKHYKIDDQMDCVDSPVSINERQFKKMVDEIRNLENIFGPGRLSDNPAEQETRVFRRSSL
jgi:N,N'-diacetyllegionaminate synthase